MTTPIPAMILAGGRSRRMGGGDKPLRLLGGRRILDYVIDSLSPQCAPLALNANGDPARFDGLLPVVSDAIADYPGPLAGILAAMDWAATLVPPQVCVLTVSGDCPFLPRDLAARLSAAMGSGVDVAVAASDGRRHPTIALWRTSLRDALRRDLAGTADRSVTAWVNRLAAVEVAWPAQPRDPFFNVNTEDDLRRAEALLGAD